MNVVGNWGGVIYFEHLRNFVPDTSLKLTIESMDQQGNIEGMVTETFFDAWEEIETARYKTDTFFVKGIFNKKDFSFYLRQVPLKEVKKKLEYETDYEIIARVDEVNRKLIGEFCDRRWKDSVQMLELAKW